MNERRAFSIGGVEVPAGRRMTIDLPAAQLSTHTPMTMPVHVVHGRREGPRLFVTAAIHGDEINGIEIIRHLLGHRVLDRLRGTLVCVPVVNVFGFVARSRYLPDRRDLNRVFPGSAGGSLASRLAHILMSEIVTQCTHGIDLHTGAIHRENLPQVRAHLGDRETTRIARAFATPVIIDANLRDGSLRRAAGEIGIPMLLYEAGEALRFDRGAITIGVRGILRVMRCLDMLPRTKRRRPVAEPALARSSFWLRAPQSGVLRFRAGLGAHVFDGDLLASVADPFGANEAAIAASEEGIVIGRTTTPVVNEGDAVYHVARLKGASAAAVVENLRGDNDHQAETPEPPRSLGA